MNNTCIVIFVLSLMVPCLAFADSFPNGEKAAVVNGKVIPQKKIVELLEACYGKGMAGELSPKVVRSFLEEMIIFEVMKMNLQDKGIKCQKQDYQEEMKRLEEPLFDLYLKRSLKYPLSFIDTLKKILRTQKKRKPYLVKKYTEQLEKMQQGRLTKDDAKRLQSVWNNMLKNRRLRSIIRDEFVLKTHYKIHPSVFKRRVVISAHLHKFVQEQISSQEVQEFARKEKFALEGGKVRVSRIVILTIDPITRQPFSEEQQQQALDKINKIYSMIKPDASNFAQLAEKYSEDQSSRFRGGDLSWIPRWTIIAEEIAKRAYHMAEGSFSKPFQTRIGYQIILAKEKKPGEQLSPRQLREKALERMVIMRRENYRQKWLEQATIERTISFR